MAPDYDEDFSHSALGRLLRTRLWSVLDAALPAGGRLLELGCGTGEDAVHMARRGAVVLATDQSAEMLRVTAVKAADAGVALQTAPLDLAAPALPRTAAMAETGAEGPSFDGAWSSFGPLNCVADRAPLWRFLAREVRQGGAVVVVVMAPLTPWDWLWFGGHGQLRTATRRLRAGAAANAGAGGSVRVWYPSWRTLRAEAQPWFTVERVEAIGALLPISEAGHLVARFPRIFGVAARLEAKLGGRSPWPSLCDHYALVLRRSAEPAAPSPSPGA